MFFIQGRFPVEARKARPPPGTWLILLLRASPVAQKNLPAKQGTQETRIRSLGREDSLEKEMATHSIIPAGEVPSDRGAWGATAHGVPKNRTQLGVHACMLLSLA